jgi:hypothetical protein
MFNQIVYQIAQWFVIPKLTGQQRPPATLDGSRCLTQHNASDITPGNQPYCLLHNKGIVDERQNKTDSYAVANHPPSTHLAAHRRRGSASSRRTAATTIAAAEGISQRR